jgi:hypothetical protein
LIAFLYEASAVKGGIAIRIPTPDPIAANNAGVKSSCFALTFDLLLALLLDSSRKTETLVVRS